MNDTGLDLCLGIDCADGFIKTFEIINAGYQNIFHTSLLQISDHAKPKVCPFAMRYIHAQDLFSAILVYTQDIVNTPCLCASFFFYLVIHRIQPYNAIQAFQRTLLPFFYQWYDFVCNGTQGGSGDLCIVGLFYVGADITKAGAKSV